MASDGRASKGGQGPDVTVRNRAVGCANGKWTVYLDHVVDSRGNEVHDFIVVGSTRPRPDMVTGVCVLPVVDGRIGLIHFYRHAVEQRLWEVPRGFVDDGEAPDAAARRELEEETGLTCRADDMVALGHYMPEPSTIQARGGVFAATRCMGTPRREEEEIGLGDFRLFSVEEVATLIERGDIQDASTMIAFYRYLAWRDAT